MIPNAGLELFAYKNPFNEKQIGCYTSRKVSKQAINKKYSDKIGHYAICNGNRSDTCIDTNRTIDSVLRYVNDARDPHLNNLKFRQRTSVGTLWLFCNRKNK